MDDASITTPKRTLQFPNILLLDGGISTHLEQKLNHGNNDKDKSSPFSHRELWSSSLLLTPEGRQEILNGHLDFLDAGCDVISTVTYQLSHHLCKPPSEETKASDEKEKGNELSKVSTNEVSNEPCTDNHCTEANV